MVAMAWFVLGLIVGGCFGFMGFAFMTSASNGDVDKIKDSEELNKKEELLSN